MSLWRDEVRPSPATLVALVAVVTVSVASLQRVFDDPSYLAWCVPALFLGAAIALVGGSRSMGASLGLTALVLLLTLPALFATDQTAYLLPTPEALSSVRALLAEGVGALSETVPPVAAEPRFAILLWTACLGIGFLGGAWVVVRRPVGAVVTALGLVVFSGGIGEGGGRDAFALAAIAASGAFFLSEGRHRIVRWSGQVGRLPGRLPKWFGVPTLMAATAFAAVTPAFVGDQPVVELNAALRSRLVVIKPLSDIQRQLQVDPPIEVMRVRSERPTYWRLTALDSYDGREWVLNARPREVRAGDVPPPEVPTTGDILVQHYTLTSLLAPWLPAAYAATHIEGDAVVEVDASSQTLLLRGETSPGLVYTVHSQLPSGGMDLQVAPRGVSDAREAHFGELAAPIVGDAVTPLEMARRLEEHFRDYIYDEDVDGGHTVERLDRFLAERTGYCEQFAATMTLMLRGLGVDARVGVGFLPGAQQGGAYVVSTREAHAWVEAKVPGIGWMSFDPTPARDDGTSPPAAEDLGTSEQTPPPTGEEEGAAQATPAPIEDPAPEAPLAPPGFDASRLMPYALVALALASVPGAKRARRLRRRSRPPERAVLGAFSELTDRAADLGHRWRDAETQREFCARLFGPVADGPADEGGRSAGRALADVSTRTLFGPEPTSAREVVAAWRALPPAERALRRQAPAWRRVAATFDPRTLIGPAARQRVRSVAGRLPALRPPGGRTGD